MKKANGERRCRYCGEAWYNREARSSCSGPSLEEMRANLARNLARMKKEQEK